MNGKNVPLGARVSPKPTVCPLSVKKLGLGEFGGARGTLFPPPDR